MQSVIRDPSDLSLVPLVTQICSFSAATETTARGSEWEAAAQKENPFGGSRAETLTEAQGVNNQQLQWDLAATPLEIFTWKQSL